MLVEPICLRESLVVVAFLMFPLAATFAQGSLGQFEGHGDIGSPKNAGSASFEPDGERYAIAGSGTNMWAKRDEFQFVWKKMRGDFNLVARAKFIDKGVEQHRKLGLIVRAGLEPDSPYVDVAAHGSGLTSLQYRRSAGEATEQIAGPIIGAEILQLERKGNKYIMRIGWDGDTFATPREVEVNLPDEVYVGMFVCAHNPDVIEGAVFENVRITVPAKDDFVPYRDYIGSNIELMDVETDRRTIVHHSPDSLQAPNWTTDGKALIYNSKGKLYRFDLESGVPSEIDTGFATNNNNDHVLSFDGKTLGISNHSQEQGGNSIIYTLPSNGGTPRQITKTGPSYLHGFSPDGKWLVFTGGRDNVFDIYKIPVDGGEEIRLTKTPGLDDGPEFSPDGKYIYFNSSRTGRMQIWRMQPGGQDQEQVTDDELNNWFPHISPNGRWLVFLSFQSDVSPDEHPFYKHVYLRQMPLPGGRPKVIAYIYGGQGTINVPSFSPDGKKIAFVSNTAGE